LQNCFKSGSNIKGLFISVIANRNLINYYCLEPTGEAAGVLIGIATTSRDYRLVHYINQSLGISLGSVDDIPVYHEKTAKFHTYPFFTWHHPDLRTDFYLIANYNASTYLIPSLRQINYFLLLQGSAYKEHIDGIIATLRTTQGIQAAIPIVPNTIKEFGPILEDLEIHVMEIKKAENSKTIPLRKSNEE